MSIHRWSGIGPAALIAVLLAVSPHPARGAAPERDGVAAGRKLVEAWCKTCHAIDANTVGPANAAPDFARVANQPSTTELALKVFLRSSHPSMPNLVLTPEQSDDIVSYILSLKR
jgi:mono/diheme cytochrome c family protein